MNIFCR